MCPLDPLQYFCLVAYAFRDRRKKMLGNTFTYTFGYWNRSIIWRFILSVYDLGFAKVIIFPTLRRINIPSFVKELLFKVYLPLIGLCVKSLNSIKGDESCLVTVFRYSTITLTFWGRTTLIESCITTCTDEACKDYLNSFYLSNSFAMAIFETMF